LGLRPLNATDTAGEMRRMPVPVPADLAGPLSRQVPAAVRGGGDGGLGGGRQLGVEGVWPGRGGWSPSHYPVRLDPGAAAFTEVAAGGAAAGSLLKRVKEQIRQVPGNGLGFG